MIFFHRQREAHKKSGKLYQLSAFKILNINNLCQIHHGLVLKNVFNLLHDFIGE